MTESDSPFEGKPVLDGEASDVDNLFFLEPTTLSPEEPAYVPGDVGAGAAIRRHISILLKSAGDRFTTLEEALAKARATDIDQASPLASSSRNARRRWPITCAKSELDVCLFSSEDGWHHKSMRDECSVQLEIDRPAVVVAALPVASTVCGSGGRAQRAAQAKAALELTSWDAVVCV